LVSGVIDQVLVTMMLWNKVSSAFPTSMPFDLVSMKGQ
jgi:hypothetical protein